MTRPTAPLPEGVVAVNGVRTILGCGRKDAYAWLRNAPGITWTAGKRLLVTRENVLKWRDGDPAVRAAALNDPNPKPKAAPQPQRPGLRMA